MKRRALRHSFTPIASCCHAVNLTLQLRRVLLGAALPVLGALAAHAQPAAPAAPPAVFTGVTQENIPLGPGGFPAFDAAFYGNQLFLLGEAHGVQRPQEIDLALLKHLNERAGVRTYVAEVDCAKAYHLNEYLRTGDEAALDLVFRSWIAGTAQWANKDLRAKFQQIRAWKRTQPRQRQMRFLGLDELQDLPLAADYVAALLRDKPLPLLLRGRIDSVMALLRQPTAAALAGAAQRAVQDLAAREAACRKTLGPGYDDLRHVLVNATYNRGGARERNIFTNFQALYHQQHLEREKLYGFWGLNHVLQSPLQGGSTSFASMVRQSNLPVRDKVVSLLCVFADCQMLMATSAVPPALQETGHRYSRVTQFNHDGPLVVVEGIHELKQRTQPGSTTLFKLNAPRAVTNREPIRLSYPLGAPLGQNMQFNPALPATAHVQYLLLVRNSAAVQPLTP